MPNIKLACQLFDQKKNEQLLTENSCHWKKKGLLYIVYYVFMDQTLITRKLLYMGPIKQQFTNHNKVSCFTVSFTLNTDIQFYVKMQSIL